MGLRWVNRWECLLIVREATSRDTCSAMLVAMVAVWALNSPTCLTFTTYLDRHMFT